LRGGFEIRVSYCRRKSNRVVNLANWFYFSRQEENGLLISYKYLDLILPLTKFLSHFLKTNKLLKSD
jgi:hypothetical protein